MVTVTDDEFEGIINAAMDRLPQQYISKLNNVAITYEDEPSEEQRNKQKLGPHQTLFGLYEGIPLTQRGGNYSMVLPDKITLFKLPLLFASGSAEDLAENVRHTLWHEIAHYYGLDHGRIHELEN